MYLDIYVKLCFGKLDASNIFNLVSENNTMLKTKMLHFKQLPQGNIVNQLVFEGI